MRSQPCYYRGYVKPAFTKFYSYLSPRNNITNDESTRILPVIKCITDANLPISTIRSDISYSFQDTVATFHKIPTNNREINTAGFSAREKTANNMVRIKREAIALTP